MNTNQYQYYTLPYDQYGDNDERFGFALPFLAGLAVTAPFWLGGRCCYGRYGYGYGGYPYPTPYPLPYPYPYPYPTPYPYYGGYGR